MANAIEARHVAVLLEPETPRLNIVVMPEGLGTWVQAGRFATRARLGPSQRRPAWRFELSPKGRELAAEILRISTAANESMRDYLAGEHAHCFPGAFRDGFARGVAWARSAGGPN